MGLFPEARPSIGELGSESISPTTFISEFILQGVPGVLLSRHTIIKRQLGRAPEKKQPRENIPRIHPLEKYYSPRDTKRQLIETRLVLGYPQPHLYQNSSYKVFLVYF